MIFRIKHCNIALNRSQHTSSYGSATGWDFFFIMKYEKPTLTIEQQIAVLQTRGLIIDDEDEAKNILDKISYFRLADYWRPLEIDKSSHRFKSNTHLCDIISIYRFDTELKQLIFNAIMQIEITTRSKMIRYFSADHTPFWFADENLCENKECFLSNIAHIRREINRSQEDFITEHFEKYDFPEFPPAWKTLEVITLGTLSKLYTNFSDNTAKNQMAKDFGLPQPKNHTTLDRKQKHSSLQTLSSTLLYRLLASCNQRTKNIYYRHKEFTPEISSCGY